MFSLQRRNAASNFIEAIAQGLSFRSQLLQAIRGRRRPNAVERLGEFRIIEAQLSLTGAAINEADGAIESEKSSALDSFAAWIFHHVASPQVDRYGRHRRAAWVNSAAASLRLQRS